MAQRTFSLTLLTLCLYISESAGSSQISQVTCGSLIKLMNVNAGVRLHSHKIKYGSGSGQQSVTGTDKQEDINSYWQIRSSEAAKPCVRGTPIACGSKLRLTHLDSQKNLHSHHFKSPLSRNQEVSAFGEDGEGDSGDVWTVLCGGSSWEMSSQVRFKHVDTDVFLAVSGHTYSRPISGQMEVIGTSYSDASTYWTAKEGVYVKPSDETSSKYLPANHDEL